ncbi:glycosyl hydrolase family 28-related protein [Arthrobacter sp. LjRoot78]|uniref:glycosyl hydrolase family 28-related protein n=1 Tax=Arthrobacter sp. LjRoot78 TaxID=3342338 RepID=UPI003ECE232C
MAAVTGASAVAALSASSAEAGPGDKTPSTAYIPTSEKGSPSGVAALDGGAKILPSQLPDLSATYGPLRTFDVQRYGAVGDGTTDDTAAVQSASTAAAAMATLGGRAQVKFPAGHYKITSPITGIVSGMTIAGDGKLTTRVSYTGTGVLFDLGTFTTNPANVWQGKVSWVTIEKMWIDVPGTSFANEGTRAGAAIRDNGGGSHKLHQIKASGFAVGFNASYGSDFTVIEECDFCYNDIGVYMGPGSQQVTMSKTQFYGNREGLVIERSIQGAVRDCQFIDSKSSDITAVFTSTGTRFGLTALSGYSHYAWNVEDCWFESDANGTGARIVPQHILTSGDGGSTYPQYFRVIRPYLVSGGTQSATTSFWRVEAGTRFEMDGLTVNGQQIKYAVDIASGQFPKFTQRNTRQVDGYTGLVLWNGGISADTTYAEPVANGPRQGRSAGYQIDKVRVIGDTQDRWQMYGDGKQAWGSGTASSDVFLYRNGVGVLQTDGAFKAGAIVSANQLASGEAVLDRFVGAHDNTPTIGSGFMLMTYFTAQKTESITQVKAATGNTAYAATPTLCRYGIFSVAGDGSLTLLASTPSDTTMFAAANTTYTRTLTSTFSKVAGVRYAVGVLVVTTAATGTFQGYSALSNATSDFALGPQLSAAVSGQTDLPSTVTAGNAQVTTRVPQFLLLP